MLLSWRLTMEGVRRMTLRVRGRAKIKIRKRKSGDEADSGQGGRVSGTCEEIGFTDFSTTYFQYLTRVITGPNSIFSHVPDTLSPSLRYDVSAADGAGGIGVDERSGATENFGNSGITVSAHNVRRGGT